MSLYGALFSGVSGLQAQSSALGAVADNITNVNTIGYKETTVQFQTLVTQQASLTQYSAGGVQARPRQGVDIQGLLQSTASALDFAISGDGFFIVNEAGNPGSGDIYGYTRAGSFDVDRDGFLQNTAGYYLQGWPLENFSGATQASTVTVNDDVFQRSYQNASGDTVFVNTNIVDNNNLRPLNLRTIGGTAVATTTFAIGANFDAGAAIGQSEQSDILIYDSLGNSHNINHTWTKRASNGWDVSVIPPAGSESIVIEDQTNDRRNYQSVGRLDFLSIPQAGSELFLNVGGTAYTIEFTAGTDDSSIDQDQITIDTAPLDGDTITINGVVYEFDTNGTNSSTSDVIVSIGAGANAPTAAAALASAIETQFDTDRGVGTWVSVSGTTITLNNSTSFPNSVSTAVTQATSGSGLAVTNTPGGAPDTNLQISVQNRSLSQILDEVANRIQGISQYEFDGVREAPPTAWAERIAGENAVFFNNVDTANNLQVDASNLTRNGVSSVQQNEAFNVEPVDSTINWTQSSNHAVAFNGDGTPDSFFGTDETLATDPRIQYKINWANGAENQDGSDSPAISVSYGNYNVSDGLTQFGGPYQINFISQNGASFGNFAGISVNQEGIVTALFDNGVTRPVFQIPIATLPNPNGLEGLTGNVWIETDFSGQPTVREAGEAGAGSTNQSALEASTVDLGQEFTDLIVVQRAYSASTQVITTADELLEELLRIR